MAQSKFFGVFFFCYRVCVPELEWSCQLLNHHQITWTRTCGQWGGPVAGRYLGFSTLLMEGSRERPPTRNQVLRPVCSIGLLTHQTQLTNQVIDCSSPLPLLWINQDTFLNHVIECFWRYLREKNWSLFASPQLSPTVKDHPFPIPYYMDISSDMFAVEAFCDGCNWAHSTDRNGITNIQKKVCLWLPKWVHAVSKPCHHKWRNLHISRFELTK